MTMYLVGVAMGNCIPFYKIIIQLHIAIHKKKYIVYHGLKKIKTGIDLVSL
jgi:hypothetical protein